MSKVVAINGSPRKDKGNTAMILNPFIQGMEEAGSEVKLYYASNLKVKPCTCGTMYCWYQKPGECCFKDEMEQLYAQLREAEIFVLATPVYIPLPGAMQDVVNRLCPLLLPGLETREGRTRARWRDGVALKKIVLVSTGGWWELGNFEIVTHIVEELAANASAEFSGAVVRPHASLMVRDGKVTADGQVVMAAAKQAGQELAGDGRMREETLAAISRPLIPEDDLRNFLNSMCAE